MFSDSIYLDLIGALLSFTTTYLYIKANANAWKVGILATSLNSVLYLSQGIYGQALLEGVYFASMWYGLWQWQQKSSDTLALKISSLSLSQGVKYTFIAVISVPVCTLILQRLESDIAMWDATICILSLIAQWFVCKKIIQNWILWFVIDAMIIFMHFNKGIPFHAILHIVYLIMAIIGYLNWHRLRHQEMNLQLSLLQN
ncbi:MAG: nicotinamide riboside transporter PnuC [Gammaproteobacteria bacterium]